MVARFAYLHVALASYKGQVKVIHTAIANMSHTGYKSYYCYQDDQIRYHCQHAIFRACSEIETSGVFNKEAEEIV